MLAVGMIFTLSAQSKLDLGSRMALRNYKTQLVPVEKNGVKTMQKLEVSNPSAVTGFIKLSDNATVEQLEAEGINVIASRGDIAMVSVPYSELERVSTLQCIKKLQLSRKVNVKMDQVRPAMGVDEIHRGSGLPRAYTGKDVIAGIVDAGFDPNHINFRNTDNTSRIKKMTEIKIDQNSSEGYSVKEVTDLSRYTTDNTETFHGTHTLGIMAGGYRDSITIANRLNAFQAEIVDTINPYYGIAYGADLAVAGGDMYDMLIALGVESILYHAYEEKKPAVINMSLGSNVGTHDGNSIMGQYLELAGEEAIICLSAGNEGDIPIAYNQTFTAEDKELKTFIYPYSNMTGYPNLRYGQVYIYSNDSTEFTFKAVIHRKSRPEFPVFTLSIKSNTEGVPVYYSSPEWTQEGDLTHANFTKAFDGYIGAGSMRDEATGRYYVLIDYYTTDNQITNANGDYILGFVVEGSEGQRIDCFCDGTYTYFSDYGFAGWDTGSCNGSISDMACARNVIVVGSYNTRNSWASLDGKNYTYGAAFVPGEVSSFSSYGTLIDGRNLPHVCAPGATTISSSSKYFIDAYASSGWDNSALQGKWDETGRVNYWHQQMGTSMSTPAVAGAIALWLEADPDLTTAEVIDIIQATAVKDEYVTGFTGDPVKWGAGKFDALAGLKEVIRRRASVEGIVADDNRLMVTNDGGDNYNIFLGGVSSLNAVLYNISGQPVKNQSVEGDELTFNVGDLASGIYILNVNGSYSQKILVK